MGPKPFQKQGAVERTEGYRRDKDCREEAENSREDRGLLWKQRAIERIKGTEGRGGSRRP
jgi:hypothetical protein